MAEKLKQTIEFQAKGIERLKGQYKDLERRTKGLEKSTKGSAGALGGLVAKLGLTTVAMYGTSRAISAVVSVGAGFEKTMSNVAAISGATGEELKALEANAKELGSTTVFTASQVGQLQTEFAKLGFSSQEITNVTEDTLALASATGTDLAQAAAVAGQTLRAFGLDTSEMSSVTDTMALSFSRSALDMEKFTNSMTYVAPIAKSVGFSVQGTTAILGGLANAGIDGSIAGTALRTIFLKLADSNSDLSKALGGSVTSADQLLPALKKLKDGGTDLTKMLELVDKRAVSAFDILLNSTDTVSNLKTELDNAAGAARDMADVQLDNLEGKVTLLNSAMEGLGISIFDHFAIPLGQSTDKLTSFIGTIDDYIKIPTSIKLETERQKVNSLSKAIELSEEGSITRNKLINELNEIYPDLLQGLSDEEIGQGKITKRLKEYNKEQSLKIALAKADEETLKLAEDKAEADIKVANSTLKVTDAMTKFADAFDGVIDPQLSLQENYDSLIAQSEEFLAEFKKQEKQLGFFEFMSDEATDALDRMSYGRRDLMVAFETGDASMTSYLDLLEDQEELSIKVAAAEELQAKKHEILTKMYAQTPAPVPAAPVPVDGGKDGDDPNKPTRDLTKAELAIYQNHLEEKRTLFDENHQFELDALPTQHEELLAIYEAQGKDTLKLQEFFDKKEAQILLDKETRTLAHYSTMASNFASFVGQFAGGQKAAARLQQVAALVDAYSAYNQLLAEPKLVAMYPANVIAASGALAAGIANAHAISKSIGEFKNAETGFDGIVDRPTMFMTGENNKAEQVSITPLESPNIAGGAASGGITINVSAPLVDETVLDSILPAIERAKQMELA